MDQLSNAFSVLDLDVPDDQLSANEIPIKSDKGKQKGNISEDTMLATNNQHNQHNLSITSEEYKDKGKQKDNISEDTTLATNNQHNQQNLSITSEEYKDKGKQKGNISEDTTLATNNQHNQQNLSITSEEYKDKGKQKGNISEDTTLATNNQHNQQNLSITSEEYKDKGKQKGNISEDTTLATDNQHNQQNLSIASEEYKLPLVWIDLEMTGLNIEVDRILEIACIITDGNLIKSVEGPDLVIHQSKECLDNMGEWCQEHHAASGLTKRVLQSTITESEAEKQVTEFVKKHVGTYTPMLAGNSVYVDLLFLKKYMPDLASLFTHVLVDVSSIKALCIRWYPRDNKKAPSKENKHRAMDDIRESIAELKYYKERIFKLKTKK